MYFDVEGTIKGKNLRTNETIELTFTPKSFLQKESIVRGYAYDAKGKKKFEIHGNWLDSLYIKDLSTN